MICVKLHVLYKIYQTTALHLDNRNETVTLGRDRQTQTVLRCTSQTAEHLTYIMTTTNIQRLFLVLVS